MASQANLSCLERIIFSLAIFVLLIALLIQKTEPAVKADEIETYNTIKNPCAGTPGIAAISANNGQIYVICRGLEASPIIVIPQRFETK